MNYSTMRDEMIILRNPGGGQQKLLDQYRLTEIFRDAYGNYMLDHFPEGRAVQEALAAVKRFKEADEVDIKYWKDLIIDLIYSRHVFGFKPWEYFGYGLENKSIAERLDFMPQRNIRIYFRALNTSREDFLKLASKYHTYQILAPYYKRDMCLLRGNEQKEAFLNFCRRHPRFIIKPDNGMAGKRVEIVNCEDYKSPEEVFTAICAKGKSGSPVVCEELIVCEDSMGAIHPQSVNTVRIFTYLRISGEPTVVQSRLKAGVGDAVADNSSVDGVTAAIDVETGVVYTDAADENNHVFPAHPDTGFVFKGFQIPRWEELKKMVLEIAPEFPGVPLIAWDMALSKDRGWQVVEGNEFGGINTIQIATKTGNRRQMEAAFEWDKHRVKLQQNT